MRKIQLFLIVFSVSSLSAMEGQKSSQQKRLSDIERAKNQSGFSAQFVREENIKDPGVKHEDGLKTRTFIAQMAARKRSFPSETSEKK